MSEEGCYLMQIHICAGNSLAAFLSLGEKDCALVHKSEFVRRGGVWPSVSFGLNSGMRRVR